MRIEMIGKNKILWNKANESYLFCNWAANSGLGSLIFGTSLNNIQNSPIFCIFPPFPVYNVKHPFHKEE